MVFVYFPYRVLLSMFRPTDGSARIFILPPDIPTGNQTHMSSVAPTGGNLIQDAFPTELPQPLQRALTVINCPLVGPGLGRQAVEGCSSWRNFHFQGRWKKFHVFVPIFFAGGDFFSEQNFFSVFRNKEPKKRKNSGSAPGNNFVLAVLWDQGPKDSNELAKAKIYCYSVFAVSWRVLARFSNGFWSSFVIELINSIS